MAEVYNNSFNTLNEEEGLRINDIIELVIKNIWWYVGVTLCCLVFAGYYLYKTPTVYNRSAKVLVDDSNQDAAMRNLGMASANMMRLRSFNSVENEIQAFSSPDLMKVVVERLNLQTKYVANEFLRELELYTRTPVEMALTGENPHSRFSFKMSKLADGKVRLTDFHIRDDEYKDIVDAQLGDTVQTPIGAIALYPTKHFAQNFNHDITVTWANSMTVAKSYCSKLSISLSGKESSVLVLSMIDQYPSRSEAILNSLVDYYNEVWINNKNRSAINTTDFINERLVVIEQELATVEEALKKYKASNNLTDIKALANLYLDESSEYASRAFEANNQLSIAQYIKGHLTDPSNSMNLIPSNLGLGNASVESQIKEYNTMVLQRDRLLMGSSDNNPMIADLNTAITSVRSAILRSVENLIATLELQIEKINSQEKQILARMSSNSGQELQLLSIERQQQIVQNLYVFLLQKREENELAALINVGNTRVIMYPNGSNSPVAPNKMMIIFAALVVGCGIPFAYRLLKRMLNNTVKTKADLGHLSMPFLAEVPRYAPEQRGYKKFLTRKEKDKDRSLSKILVEHGSRDMMNEAFRVLRTNVDLVLGKKNGSRVLMLTSFNPNAGKTFISMNLAASMALKGAKVALIDLDLRKGSLSKSLGVDHSGVAADEAGSFQLFHPLDHGGNRGMLATCRQYLFAAVARLGMGAADDGKVVGLGSRCGEDDRRTLNAKGVAYFISCRADDLLRLIAHGMEGGGVAVALP